MLLQKLFGKRKYKENNTEQTPTATKSRYEFDRGYVFVTYSPDKLESESILPVVRNAVSDSSWFAGEAKQYSTTRDIRYTVAELQPDDVFIVRKFEQLPLKSVGEIIDLIKVIVFEKKAHFICIDDKLKSTDENFRTTLELLETLYRLDRSKQYGNVGPKHILNDAKIKAIKKDIESGKTITSCAKEANVSISTLRRALAR